MPPAARAGRQAAKPLGSHQQKKGAFLGSFPPGEIPSLSASSSSSKTFRGSAIPFAASLSQTTRGGTQYLLELFSVGKGHRIAPPDPGSPSPGSEQVQPKTAAASVDKRRLVHR